MKGKQLHVCIKEVQKNLLRIKEVQKSFPHNGFPIEKNCNTVDPLSVKTF